MELGHKMQQPQLFVLTAPLMTNAAGFKMGKTEKGAVWLNAEQLDDYDYWQFWRNVDDQKVESFLKIFTDLPLETIEDCLGAREASDYNKAKELLANEQTSLCRGSAAQQQAASRAAAMFGESSQQQLEHLPRYDLSEPQISLVDFLARHGLASSKSQARALIAGHGVKINGQTITDQHYMLHRADYQQPALLSLGKKRHYQIGSVDAASQEMI
jgi:tyrosyl-tRNA synthetase